jgi:hypothetical protein
MKTISGLALILFFLQTITQAEEDWRLKKIEAYQKIHGKRDKHGNPEGREHDLGGNSKLEGNITFIFLPSDEGPMEHLNLLLMDALKKRIDVDVIAELPSSSERFEAAITDSTQLWIWAGKREECLPPDYIEVVCEKVKKGMSVFLLADNTPYTKGVDALLNTISEGSRISGNYEGRQMLRRSSSGPGFDGKHPLFRGIVTLYEGVTVSTMSGPSLRTVARSTDGNPLICVAQTPPGYGRIIVTGGFTAFFDMHWDTAGTERLALNAAAFLSGLDE